MPPGTLSAHDYRGFGGDAIAISRAGLRCSPHLFTAAGRLVRREVTLEQDIVEWRQFRSKLVEFFRLPVNVTESGLRGALNSCSPNLLNTYLRRFDRVMELKYGTAASPGLETPFAAGHDSPP